MKSYGKLIKNAVCVFQMRLYELLALLLPKTCEGKLYVKTALAKLLAAKECTELSIFNYDKLIRAAFLSSLHILEVSI